MTWAFDFRERVRWLTCATDFKKLKLIVNQFLLISLHTLTLMSNYALAANCNDIIQTVSYKEFKLKALKVKEAIKDFNFNSNRLTWKGSSEDPIVEYLGSGYRAEVVLLKSGKVLKIARGSVEDAYKIFLESEINKDLRDNYSKYGIRVDTIVSRHHLGIFLEKELLDSDMIASQIVTSKSALSKRQYEALRSIFNGAVRYAEERGIGLDLKASNLYWNKKLKEWVLFDCGPRTSYLPFGFTTDLTSFDEYLNIWLKEDPDE